MLQANQLAAWASHTFDIFDGMNLTEFISSWKYCQKSFLVAADKAIEIHVVKTVFKRRDLNFGKSNKCSFLYS